MQFTWSPWLKAPQTDATRTLKWIAHIYSHTYIINTVTTTLCEAPAQLLHNLQSNLYFEGTWGRGRKPEYPEKPPPDSLPANRYHRLQEKIQRPGQESNPNPPTLVISSPGQVRAPRLTHWATDRHNIITQFASVPDPMCSNCCLLFVAMGTKTNRSYSIGGLDSKELVSAIPRAKDVAKGAAVCDVSWYERNLVYWVSVQYGLKHNASSLYILKITLSYHNNKVNNFQILKISHWF